MQKYKKLYFLIKLFSKKGNVKIILGIIGGFILALLGTIVTTSIFALFLKIDNMIIGSISFLAIWVVGIMAAYLSKSIGKTWRRFLLICASFSFLLPLAGLFYTGVSVLGVIETGSSDATIVGTAILGLVMSCIMGIFGVSLGTFLLMVRLLSGRSKPIDKISTGA